MKLLVLVLGWVVLIPVLTPIAAIPVLLVVGKFLRSAFPKLSFPIIFVFLGGVIAGLTYLNIQKGLGFYFEFLGRNGIETTSTVINVSKSGGLASDGSASSITLEFQNKAGNPVRVPVSLSERRMYPYNINKLNLAPETGDKIPVRYFHSMESNLIINTEPKLSAFGQKIECLNLHSEVKNSKLRASVDVIPSRTLIDEYRAAIQRMLDSPCLTNDERKDFQAVLSAVK